MKKLTITSIILLGIFTMSFQPKDKELIERTKFASVEKSKELLKTKDSFTNRWSKFDINSRVGKPNSNSKELFSYISDQVLQWTDAETELIDSILQNIQQSINNKKLKLYLPKTLYFIKTTLKEESGAIGYTRSNYIVLREDLLEIDRTMLEHIIAHELFHIQSRINPEFREKMYELIGFRLMNEISYPDNLKDFKITNPDAPLNDSYITLTKGKKSLDCMMVLFANKPYSEGKFIQYLNVGFLKLSDTKPKQIDLTQGDPIIYSFKDVENFFSQVGKNTRYAIDPEEILADNYAYLIQGKEDVPDKDILQRIQDLLKKDYQEQQEMKIF